MVAWWLGEAEQTLRRKTETAWGQMHETDRPGGLSRRRRCSSSSGPGRSPPACVAEAHNHIGHKAQDGADSWRSSVPGRWLKCQATNTSSIRATPRDPTTTWVLCGRTATARRTRVAQATKCGATTHRSLDMGHPDCACLRTDVPVQFHCLLGSLGSRTRSLASVLAASRHNMAEPFPVRGHNCRTPRVIKSCMVRNMPSSAQRQAKTAGPAPLIDGTSTLCLHVGLWPTTNAGACGKLPMLSRGGVPSRPSTVHALRTLACKLTLEILCAVQDVVAPLWRIRLLAGSRDRESLRTPLYCSFQGGPISQSAPPLRRVPEGVPTMYAACLGVDASGHASSAWAKGAMRGEAPIPDRCRVLSNRSLGPQWRPGGRTGTSATPSSPLSPTQALCWKMGAMHDDTQGGGRLDGAHAAQEGDPQNQVGKVELDHRRRTHVAHGLDSLATLAPQRAVRTSEGIQASLPEVSTAAIKSIQGNHCGSHLGMATAGPNTQAWPWDGIQRVAAQSHKSWSMGQIRTLHRVAVLLEQDPRVI